jgi:hypothetical protein
MDLMLNRRSVLQGAALAGAALALPARALAAGLEDDFDSLFGTAPKVPLADPAPYVAPMAVAPRNDYERGVMAIARREVERAGQALWRRDIAAIADFDRASHEPRFHFVNLENGTIRSFLVAHGTGSDPQHDGFLKHFSNEPGSNATSRGSYLTCEWYKGKYGTSIRLEGLDPDNSNALPRAIVAHPAWYAEGDMVSKWGKLGRSNGCFAMGEDMFKEMLWNLSGGRLIYADKLGLT